MNIDALQKEIKYRTSRSSGAGGQHVNKVETRVEAIFNLSSSIHFSDEQKETIQIRMGRRINSKGELVVSSAAKKSQLQNKNTATERLIRLLLNSLQKQKARKPTTIPASSDRKRLKKKKVKSETKARRNFNPDTDL